MGLRETKMYNAMGHHYHLPHITNETYVTAKYILSCNMDTAQRVYKNVAGISPHEITEARSHGHIQGVVEEDREKSKFSITFTDGRTVLEWFQQKIRGVHKLQSHFYHLGILNRISSCL